MPASDGFWEERGIWEETNHISDMREKVPIYPQPRPPALAAAVYKGYEAIEHRVYKRGDRGVSYKDLFWPWLDGSYRIDLIDRYIRDEAQIRNLKEFLKQLSNRKGRKKRAWVVLQTSQSEEDPRRQRKLLKKVGKKMAKRSIHLQCNICHCSHARSIITDTGWKISLDRGLDIFFPAKSPREEQVDQRNRRVRDFEVTYIRTGH